MTRGKIFSIQVKLLSLRRYKHKFAIKKQSCVINSLTYNIKEFIMSEQARMITETTPTHHQILKRISWTAILSGALVGVGASFLLNLFCIGIGVSAFTPIQEGTTVLAVGGLIGLAVSAFISMFAAGWVAGYLGRPFAARRHLGELYGFITWSVALIITIVLASHVDKFISNFSDTMIVVRPHAAVVNFTTNDATQHTVNAAETATNAVAVTAFTTFFLFFIGAMASCFGGAVAMRCGKGAVHAENCSCKVCHK